MKVKIKKNNAIKKYEAEEGKNLLTFLQELSYEIYADCNGNGTCGKCLVKDLKENKLKQACRVNIIEDMEIEVFDINASGLNKAIEREINAKKSAGIGLALDIGTTTLAFSFVDLENGRDLKNFSQLNPQRSFGADVISRITACKNGKTKLMQNVIVKAVNDNILKSGYDVEKIVVVGNTTMLHLFLGQNASGLGEYPFKPNFLEKQELNGKDIGINAKKIILLPSISAFVGADINAGILASGMTKGNNVLLDIGTNGEIVLQYNEKLYSTSTAAGPCFEGAKISCGIGGVAGAIDSVQSGKITTINNEKAIGICGSGLIDAISVMLEKNIIDETGAFKVADRYYLTDTIYVSGRDVREFQLAKSAIRAGLVALITFAECKYDDIDNLFLAGGLGYYINKESACRVGLLPTELKDKIKVVGNTALAGAKMCLLNERYVDELQDVALTTTNLNLSTNEVFIEEYLNNMTF